MDDRPRYRNEVLVYTAKDIYDDVSAGMDPDCLFVSLEKFEAERVNNSAGTRRGRAGTSRWKQQDEIVCMPNTVCCATACDDEDARLIVTKHNADIAALEAERDEWEARCKNLVNAMAVHGYSPESLARIAEGRDE